jgi:putative colanic acid biosynthesis glycosyltransferase
MKILQISQEGNLGSVGSIANHIGDILIDQGHQSFIAIGNHEKKSKSIIFKFGNIISKINHGLATRIFDKNGLASSNPTVKLIKWIKLIKPDIIHIHQIHGYYVNYEILFNFLKESNIPVILTLHDCWTFTGHCTYFESVSCEKWKTKCYDCELKHEYPKSYFIDNSTSNFLLKRKLFNSLTNIHLVSVSNWLNSLVSKSFLKKLSKNVIYNGIDLKVFNLEKSGDSNPYADSIKNKFIILGVASPWDERKGLKDFIKLSQILRKNEVIVLIGLSKNQIKFLPENIIGIPKIESKFDLANHYRYANIFVNFSKAETFGLTTVEAMACGTSVITYKSTAFPEIIGEGTGFMIDNSDFKKVIEIIDLKKNEKKSIIQSQRCHDWVKEKFNAEDKYLEYIDLYKEILDKNTSPKDISSFKKTVTIKDPTLLQICVQSNKGSVGRISEEIGLKFKQRGWKSYIAHGRDGLKSDSELIKFGNFLSLSYHFLITRFFDKHGLGSKLATKLLIKKIEKLNPNIILLHHLHGYYINIEVLFKYLTKRNKKVFWVFHDCWAITGHCAYFDYVDCNLWELECSNCIQKNEYPKSILIDRSNKNFKAKKFLFTQLNDLTIITVSDWLSNITSRSFLKNKNRVTIPNGIDINSFYPYQSNNSNVSTLKKYNLKSEKIIIGVASVWDNRKGLQEFIKLRKILNKEILIILLGLSKKQIISLPSGIKGIGLTENIQELVDLYNLADIYVNLSLEDAFPTTNLEAISCGKPVITYNTGGSPESICSETGIVVEKYNIHKVNSAINLIISKGKNYYSNKCRNKAIKSFDANKCFEEYYNLFVNSLENR